MTPSKHTRMKIKIELDVEVVDADLLRRAAFVKFDSDVLHSSDSNDANERAEENHALVREGDLEDALTALVDPFDVIPGSAGVGHHGTSRISVRLSEAEDPCFGDLFEVCHCKKRFCLRCGSFQLTPATARALWRAAETLSDDAYDDIETHGDDPVVVDDDWALFGEYPRITYTQNAVWRRQAARAFDDLSDDLTRGEWPQLTCPAEEMALHRMLDRAEATAKEGWWSDTSESDPVHRDDFDWSMAGEVFFQDTDILSLFDDGPDSIDNPIDQANAGKGAGNYRPEAWFESFTNMPGRDGRRPFRR